MLGLIALQTLSLKLALLFHSDISLLPHAIALVASLFLGLVATLPLLTLRDRLGRSACLLVGLASVLLPVGEASFEIHGRILNLGFYMPVVAEFVLFALIYRHPPLWAAVLLHLSALALMWTFPVVIGQYVLFAVFDQLRRRRDGRGRLWPLVGAVLVFGLALAPLGADVVTKTGGVSLPFKSESLIEFALARSILFPPLAMVYSHLTDPLVLAVFAALLLSVGLYTRTFARGETALTDYRIFFALNFGLMLAATLVMRRGLSSVLDDYATSAPDRYYTGVNIMFLVAWMVFALSNPSRGLRRLAAGGFTAMIASWFFLTPSLFESASPFQQTDYGTFRDTICRKQAGDGTPIPFPPPGFVLVPSYPVTPDQGWRTAIAEDVFDQTAARHCSNPNAP